MDYFDYLDKIGELLEKAQEYANEIGIDDLSKVGIIREIIMASKLKHIPVKGKHNHDAEDDEGRPIEYLTKKEGNSSFCFDCMFSRPKEEKEKSLQRITRNYEIYCGSFSGIECVYIYKVDVEVVKNFVDENLEKRDKNGKSKNNEHTVGIPERLVKEKGELIYDGNGRS